MITRRMRLLVSTLAVMGLAGAAWADAGDKSSATADSSERRIILAQLDTSNGNAAGNGQSSDNDPVPTFTSSKAPFTLRPRGRLMIDYANLNPDHDPAFGDFDDNGIEVRSGRFGIEGNLFDHSRYVIELEFGQQKMPVNIVTRNNFDKLAALGIPLVELQRLGTLAFFDFGSPAIFAALSGLAGEDLSDDNDVTITDAYVAWDFGSRTVVRLGQFKQLNSLEHQQSLSHSTFMEKASYIEGLGMGRRIGVSVDWAGDHWSLSVGGFGQKIDPQASSEKGWLLAARATWAPIHRGNRLLHLGASWFWRDYAKSSPTTTYYARPQSHFSEVAYLSTGVVPADHDIFWGLEAAAVWGPVSFQAEFGRDKLDFPGDIDDLDDPTFISYYADVSWYLTGEQRNYSARKGVFGRTHVRNPVTDGGWGAWQIAVRYDELDLEDEFRIDGGRQESYTAALNWHLNDYFRIAANYVHTKIQASGSVENIFIFGMPGDNDIDIFEIRAQLDFGPIFSLNGDTEIIRNPSGPKNVYFSGEPGALLVGIPGWSYGTDGTSSGRLVSFRTDRDFAPYFNVKGGYEFENAIVGDASRAEVFITYFGAFNGEPVEMVSKPCAACADLVIAVDGSDSVSLLGPDIASSLEIDYNYWDTGLRGLADFSVSDGVTFTSSLALFGGGQQQQYLALIAHGDPTGTSNVTVYEDVDSWFVGVEAGLAVDVALTNTLSAVAGGTIAYVRMETDMDARDCSAVVKLFENPCPGAAAFSTETEVKETFDSYRAGATIGLKADFGRFEMSILGEVRSDLVPKVNNPTSLGVSGAELGQDHIVSYGGRIVGRMHF